MEETLLILQESQCDSLLELVDAVSRWMFSVPALVFFGLLAGSPDRLSRRTPGRTPFHQKQTLFCGVTFLRARPLPATLFSVHDHGRQRSDRGPQRTFLPSRWPDCTLTRLRAEEHDRPVTQSIAIPEPSSRTIPTLDRTLVARWSLECVATPGSRRSCPG